MSLGSFLGKLRCHFGNGIANILAEDSVSKRARNAVYRLMGMKLGQGSSFAGAGYISGGPFLTMGRDCFVNRDYYIDLSAPVSIGDNVVIGTHCILVTANHEIGPSDRRAGPVNPAPIAIGDGAWIGTRVTVLPGVSIGKGAVVASGSVVRDAVPDNALVAGVPARIKKTYGVGDGDRI